MFVINKYRFYVYHYIRTLLGLSSVFTAFMCTTICGHYYVCHHYIPPLYVPRYADFTRFVISIYRLYVYHDIRTLLGLSSVYTAFMCTTD